MMANMAKMANVTPITICKRKLHSSGLLFNNVVSLTKLTEFSSSAVTLRKNAINLHAFEIKFQNLLWGCKKCRGQTYRPRSFPCWFRWQVGRWQCGIEWLSCTAQWWPSSDWPYGLASTRHSKCPLGTNRQDPCWTLKSQCWPWKATFCVRPNTHEIVVYYLAARRLNSKKSAEGIDGCPLP